MSGALYYPTWSLNDPVTLGEFLLCWDRLTFITPDDRWSFPVHHVDRHVEDSLREAHGPEYAIAHVPSRAEKEKCDTLVRRVFSADVVDIHRYVSVIGSDPMHLGINKLAYETIQFLAEQQLVKQCYGDTVVAERACCHIVMAILASCCSSENLPPITTNENQFKLQMLSLDDSLRCEASGTRSVDECPRDAFSMLLKRIRLPRAESRDPWFLRQVLVARKKDDVNGCRAAFQGTVKKYCQKLRGAQCGAEIVDVLREFDDRLHADQARLARELRHVGVGTLLSKDGVVALATGLVASSVSAGLGVLAGGMLGLQAYGAARRDVLGQHWTSWLHEVEHPHFSVW